MLAAVLGVRARLGEIGIFAFDEFVIGSVRELVGESIA
jgi:hypothetical protein